jgi:predicted DNA binding CopG/RHH family protein
MNTQKTIPQFSNEDEEREFWAVNSPLDYLDSFRPVQMDFSKLKPTTKTISLRLPESLLAHIKMLANKRDVPYQSFIKMLLARDVEQEITKYKTA